MGAFHHSKNLDDASLDIGEVLHGLAVRLFPICRSLTGNGVRQTLNILREHIPLQIHEVPSGTQVLDWTIPKEWNIRDAFVEDEHSNRIIDFQKQQSKRCWEIVLG